MHKWARTAAQVAVCSSQQGNDAFWKASNFFFHNQLLLKPDTVFSQFMEFIHQDGVVNEDSIRNCIASKGAEPLISRDAALASFLGVTVTPTLFINGGKAPGFRTAEELIAAIDAAAETRGQEIASKPGATQ